MLGWANRMFNPPAGLLGRAKGENRLAGGPKEAI